MVSVYSIRTSQQPSHASQSIDQGDQYESYVLCTDVQHLMHITTLHITALHSRFANDAPNTRVLNSQGSRIEIENIKLFCCP